MIRVKVFLPMGLSGHSVDQQGWMSIEDGSNLNPQVRNAHLGRKNFSNQAQWPPSTLKHHFEGRRCR